MIFDVASPTQPKTIVDLSDSGRVAIYQIQNTGHKSFYVKFKETGPLLKLKPGADPVSLNIDWKLMIYPISFSHMKGWYKYMGDAEMPETQAIE